MKKTLMIAAVVSSLAMPALADPHHPDGAQGQMMQGQNMMGNMMGSQGMKGQGMMNCPMMGMMGGGEPRIEGRIAFLKAELKITGKQEAAWTAYANTLRTVMQDKAGKMGQMGQSMMMQGGERKPAPEALQSRIDMMEGMIASLKKMQSATSKLYSALDDDQKETADELLGMRCAMGGMH